MRVLRQIFQKEINGLVICMYVCMRVCMYLQHRCCEDVLVIYDLRAGILIVVGT